MTPQVLRRTLLVGWTGLALVTQIACAHAEDAAKSPVASAGNEKAKADVAEDAEVLTDSELDAQKQNSTAMARDLTPTLKPIYELGDDDAKPGRIGVQAWVNSKDLAYEIGSKLAVSVRPKKDAYITVLNVGSSGRVTVIYPNHYQRDAKVKAETTVRIPSRKAKWEIAVGGPSGVDLVKVIASKNPLTLKELQSLAAADEKNPVITLGRSAEEAYRDLSPVMKPTEGDDADPKFGVKNILVRVRKEKD